MGLGNFLSRAKAFGSRMIGNVGGTVRKIADFAAPVVRKIGENVRPIADSVSGIALALGQPEIALAAQGVSKLADMYMPKVQNVINKAGAFGSKLESYGKG